MSMPPVLFAEGRLEVFNPFFTAFCNALIGLKCKTVVFRGDAKRGYELPLCITALSNMYVTADLAGVGDRASACNAALAAWAVHKYGLESLDALCRLGDDATAFADQIADEWEDLIKPESLEGIMRAVS